MERIRRSARRVPRPQRLMALGVDMMDDDIRSHIRGADAELSASGSAKSDHGYLVTVSGFDEDPREVWQIPEVPPLLRWYVVLGGLGVTQPDKTDPHHPGLCAIQVYGIGYGYIRSQAGGPIPTDRYRAAARRSISECVRLRRTTGEVVP